MSLVRAAALVVVGILSAPSFACSFGPEETVERDPNRALEQADAVLIATVTSSSSLGRDFERERGYISYITIRELWKGDPSKLSFLAHFDGSCSTWFPDAGQSYLILARRIHPYNAQLFALSPDTMVPSAVFRLDLDRARPVLEAVRDYFGSPAQ